MKEIKRDKEVMFFENVPALKAPPVNVSAKWPASLRSSDPTPGIWGAGGDPVLSGVTKASQRRRNQRNSCRTF